MKICHLNAPLAALLAAAVGSCVDKDYNLDDIDTTSQFRVNNLVIPINIEQINLSTVIDIDDESDIKIIDGEYAYVTDGDFSTSSISIPEVRIKAAEINPLSVDLTLPGFVTQPLQYFQLPDYSIDIPEESTTYDFSAANVTSDICDLTRVGGDFDVYVKIEVKGVETLASSYSIKNLQIQLPRGLEFTTTSGKYDSATGILTINGDVTSPTLEISGRATALNIPTGAFSESEHTLSLTGGVGIIGGSLAISPRADWSIPSRLGLDLKFSFSDIEVKSIDGVVQHSIDNVKIPDIDISNLPDLLAQSGTNLVLANPRLYLDVNNPLYTTGVYAHTGFEITSFHGTEGVTRSIDNSYLTIAANATDYLVLSPEAPAGHEAYTHVPFTGLRDVLSGNGLPDKLEVELTDPKLPRQTIANFPIGYNFGEITGNYRFEAPLQFGAGTRIEYKEVNDGWGDEDIENLTIEHLEVSMKVTTDVPVSIDLVCYPLNSKGERMNVTISPLNIEANANNQQVTLGIDGVIRDLDGIEFTATASAQSDASALSPNMSITISELRPCVSGYYEKEL